MITFRSTSDQTEHRVLFTPRPGTSLGAKEISRKLIYGYRCGFCRNPILFAFLTPHKVTLKKYEETRVVNGVQEFHMSIPSPVAQHETAYQITFTKIPGQEMGIQRVMMWNHVVREEMVGKKEASSESGHPRCCPYVCIAGSRPDLLIRDTILIGGFKAKELPEYNLPDWAAFEELMKNDGRHFFTKGIGGLPLVSVRSDFITDEKGLSHWRGVLMPFKKVEQPAPAVPAAKPLDDPAEAEQEAEAISMCPGCWNPKDDCTCDDEDEVGDGPDDDDDDEDDE